MEVVKTTDNYTVVKKRNGRYGVKNKSKKWVNADEKVKILLAEGLIKVSVAAEKPAEEAPEEAAAEETSTEEATPEA